MSQLDQLLLAVFLMLTMFGMGATLSLGDFSKVVRRPALLGIGLASQFGWMPLIAFGLAHAFGFGGAVAVGLIVMGSSSGGTTSNLFSYYARADLALSISMTITSTIAAVALMPLVLWIYATPFASNELAIPYSNIITTLIAVLLPVGLGMSLRRVRPAWATRAERIGSVAGIAVLVLVVVSSTVRDSAQIFSYTGAEIIAATLLGPIGFLFGHLGARMLGVAVRQRRTISLETGIQNAPLAIGIVVLSFPGVVAEEALRIPLLYGVLVVPASALLAAVFRAHAAESDAKSLL